MLGYNTERKKESMQYSKEDIKKLIKLIERNDIISSAVKDKYLNKKVKIMCGNILSIDTHIITDIRTTDDKLFFILSNGTVVDSMDCAIEVYE